MQASVDRNPDSAPAVLNAAKVLNRFLIVHFDDSTAKFGACSFCELSIIVRYRRFCRALTPVRAVRHVTRKRNVCAEEQSASIHITAKPTHRWLRSVRAAASCGAISPIILAIYSDETWQLGDVFKDSEQITKSVEAYSEGIRLAPAYEVTSPRRIVSLLMN